MFFVICRLRTNWLGAFSILIYLFAANMGYTATISVPSDHPTIQQAIDNADNGDTVLVAPGTYREFLNIKGKNIILDSTFLPTSDPKYIRQTIINATIEDGLTDGDNVIALNNIFLNISKITVKKTDGKSILSHNLFWNNTQNEVNSNIDKNSLWFVDPLLTKNHLLKLESPRLDARIVSLNLLKEFFPKAQPPAYSGKTPGLGAFEFGEVDFRTINNRHANEGKCLVLGTDNIETLWVPVPHATYDKPQSKVWTMSNTWFGLFPTVSGFKAFRLNKNKWTDATNGSIEFGLNAKADCLATDKDLYVLLVTGEELLVNKLQYSNRMYQIVENISIAPVGKVETATIALDSDNRLWISGDANDQIFVYAIDSTLDKSTIQGPYVLASGISSDDISAIIAFGGNKIGVFFSNQNRSMFGFRWHEDGEPLNRWSELEVVDDTKYCADDHINIKTDNSGRIYAAVKTSFDDIKHPPCKTLIALYYRTANAKWSDMINVVELSERCNPSRPMLQIDPQNNRLYVFYNNYFDGSIEMAESTIPSDKGTLFTRFTSQTTLLKRSDVVLVDVSGSKGVVDPKMGMLIVAGGRRKAIVESRLTHLETVPISP